jgi:pyruvate dehydrogenase E1 component
MPPDLPKPARPAKDLGELDALNAVQDRVLWLSTLMVHHANKVRPNAGGVKVGGHQASSASMVGIMTSLFFDFMCAGDRISVKPHASPVLHAIHYLLGNLDRRYLTMLREFHGLQAYPSRTKDPDPVDFSTGSVGLGSVAPNFAALVDRFVEARFPARRDAAPRFISVLGDAELDEGSVWEALAEPALGGLDNLIWVIDLNRQSLDRVVAGIRVRQLEDMFRANGWNVLEAKYGRRLEAAFRQKDGEELRRLIDDMPNEEYQFLLRAPALEVRARLGSLVSAEMPDEDLRALFMDLGGHDLSVLRTVLKEADRSHVPAVVFAYTIKGWGLPIAGDPLNHSALLSADQMNELQRQLGIPAGSEWDPFAGDSGPGRLCVERADLLRRRPVKAPSPLPIPEDLDRRYAGTASSQRIFGGILTDLARTAPLAAERIVTVSPDVATSTNLGGWINKVGVWDPANNPDRFLSLGPRTIHWNRRSDGQHIELGISETNLMMMLGQLGLTAETYGEQLYPVGTLYDPFIARALDAYIHGLYSGSRFILVGTPSGISLATEGGAHQSIVTPSIGLSLPNVVYYEPCFAQELEWILLEALDQLQNPDGWSAYIRLSTVPVDQELLRFDNRAALRKQVLGGAYRLIDMRAHPSARDDNQVEIWATGVIVPEAVCASKELLEDGVFASVINCVSPDLVYRSWLALVAGHTSPWASIADSIGTEGRPVVTVIDGHPSALSWVGSMLGVKAWPLGVTKFGESGNRDQIYAAAGIDSDAICSACFKALS